MRRGLRALPFLVLAILVVAIAVIEGPADPAGFRGTLALRRFLANTGFEVAEEDAPPALPGTFVLLADFRDEPGLVGLLEWVRRGGRLVVTTPGSDIARKLGVRPVGVVGTSPRPLRLGPGCLLPEALGVREVEVRGSDTALLPSQAGSLSCFRHRRGGGGFAVAVRHGRGRVILLGGASPLTNELLGRADNAVFALQALGGGSRRIVFGPPLPAGAALGRRGVWESLPAPAKAAVVQLFAALAAFGMFRARRLGRPVIEEPPSPIPASELVRATAKLYRRSGSAGFAGRLLRRGFAHRLARRLGLPGGPPGEEVESLFPALATEEGLAELRRLLEGPEPPGDDELIALGRGLESLWARIESSQ